MGTETMVATDFVPAIRRKGGKLPRSIRMAEEVRAGITGRQSPDRREPCNRAPHDSLMMPAGMLTDSNLLQMAFPGHGTSAGEGDVAASHGEGGMNVDRGEGDVGSTIHAGKGDVQLSLNVGEDDVPGDSRSEHWSGERRPSSARPAARQHRAVAMSHFAPTELPVPRGQESSASIREIVLDLVTVARPSGRDLLPEMTEGAQLLNQPAGFGSAPERTNEWVERQLASAPPLTEERWKKIAGIIHRQIT